MLGVDVSVAVTRAIRFDPVKPAEILILDDEAKPAHTR